MKIIVAAIGRMKKGPEQELVKRYQDRLQKSGRSIGITHVETIELLESKAQEVEQRKEAESKAILERLPEKTSIVLFDERGKTVNSRQFAHLLDNGACGQGHMAFVIGGADGHGDRLRERADYILSFGALTMPHQLVRILVYEQLYRASTILTRHPYHRD